MKSIFFKNVYTWNATDFQKKLDKFLAEFFPIPKQTLEYKWRKDRWDRLKDLFRNSLRPIFLVLPRFPTLDGEMKPKNITVYTKHLSFRYGYNVALREKIKRLLHDDGWRVTKETLSKGNDTLTVKKAGELMYIEFTFTQWESGSTCQRVKIGTEMVEQDVYDIICNEAALEMQEQEAANHAN